MARHRRDWGTGSIHAVKGGAYWRVSIPLEPDPFGRRKRKEWQYRSKAAAERKLSEVQRRLDRGLPPEESVLTLAEYAPEWLASLQVKDSTKAMYDSLVRNQLGWLGDVRLTRIMPQDIRALLAEREAEGYAGRTRRGILDILRMILRLAQNDGLIERNAAELVDAPPVNAKEPIHFTAEQARRFLDAAKDDNLYSLYAVALGTGLRRGELLGLTWRDVDASMGTILIRRGKTAAAARVVPLPAFARTALLPATANRPSVGNVGASGRAGRGSGGSHNPSGVRMVGQIWPYDPSYVTRHVGVICARAGLPRLTFHGLRHSTASILLAEGVPMEIIRQILGHSRVAMSGHYARAEDEQKREALERLGRAVTA